MPIEGKIRIDEKEPPCYGRTTNNQDGTYCTVDFRIKNNNFLKILAVSCEVGGFDWLTFFKDLWNYTRGGKVLPDVMENRQYKFRMELDNRKEGKIGVNLRYFISDSIYYPSWKPHEVTLTERTQQLILKDIEEQCLEMYGTTCEEMLAEAARRWARYGGAR